MRTLKTILYVILAVLLALFAVANWVPVTLRLWPPYELVIRLPVLIVAAVLAGAFPGALVHRVSRWRWQRRLTRTERELEAVRPVGSAAAPVAGTDSGIIPPQAQPMVVPPAGA